MHLPAFFEFDFQQLVFFSDCGQANQSGGHEKTGIWNRLGIDIGIAFAGPGKRDSLVCIIIQCKKDDTQDSVSGTVP